MKRIICAALAVFKSSLSKYIDLGEYKGIEVDTSSDGFGVYYDNQISSDVANYDLYVRKTEGRVEDGDTANIDYVGKKDGVAFDGGTADGYDLVIGSGSFIDGFEDGLIGAEIGSTVDLNLEFPDDYQSEELAGKAVVFTVTVNYVKTDEERIALVKENFSVTDEVLEAVLPYEALLFEKGKTAKDFEQTELALMPEKPCPLNVTVSKGAVLVTESFSVDGSRLYMVQNIRNTVEQFMYKQRASLAEIDLRESAGKAKFYFRGEEITLNSENGKVKRRMNCGDAIFIEING